MRGNAMLSCRPGKAPGIGRRVCPKECCAKWEFGELEQLVVAAV